MNGDHNPDEQQQDTMPPPSHTPISPAILYWGTPVVLVSTLNPDTTPNLAPMSSAFWLGDRCVLGLAQFSQTTQNLLRTRQAVLNLPSSTMTSVINALARTTGTEVLPEGKKAMGYRYVKDKFRVAGLTAVESDIVKPPRVRECPVNMEVEVVAVHDLMDDLESGNPMKAFSVAVEVKVKKTWVVDEIRMVGRKDRIDPDKWGPMIMSFQKLYGLDNDVDERNVGREKRESVLAGIDEEMYRPR